MNSIEHMFAQIRHARPMGDPESSQRAVLDALLEAHPRTLGVDEPEAELADIARVTEALDRRGEDGLVNRLGDRVGASRAAVRFEALRA
jgi:hypothetical protein